MQEKELIEVCKRLVERQFNLPDSRDWKQRDFEYLSDLIFEKTLVRLSVSTLKRLWKDYDNRVPQTHTLSTLANLLGFQNWNEFKRTHTQENSSSVIQEPVAEQNVPANAYNRKLLIPGCMLVMLLLGYLGFSHLRSSEKSFDTDKILFRSKKAIAAGVPNTVVFEYDISMLDVDSAFIQQSWDERLRAKINKNDHFQTFIYYYPGTHAARLIVNNQVVKLETINIATNGWVALVEDDDVALVPHYLSSTDTRRDGQLFVSRDVLSKNAIAGESKKFYVDYFNVRDFENTVSTDFTFETKIKNRLEDGGLICQYSQVTILCENGRISIPFCNPGCISNIHLHVSDVFRDGKKNDLTAFGIDLSQWQTIAIRGKGKTITISVGDKPIYDLSYKKDLGEITGFHYRFYGQGAVDFVQLHNEKGARVFLDEF